MNHVESESGKGHNDAAPRYAAASTLRDAAAEAVFAAGGEMGSRMRAFEWASTPLGPPDAWPQSLKTCVRIMLTSRQPIWIGWGEQLIYLYNDPYKSIIGGKHPEALGQPTSVVWREIWHVIGPMLSTAMTGNEGTYVEAMRLIMERYGYEEETFYTFSYSPVPNDQGGTGGIICANTDDTRRVIGERQMALLRQLAARTADARTIEDACTLSANALATNPRDLPFALIYLLDPSNRGSAVLAGSTGTETGHPAAPEIVSLDGASVWPFDEVLRTREIQVVDLGISLGAPPTGWDRPPTRAAVLPIAPSGETGRAGFLVVGLNPFRLLDDDYAGFLRLITGQISASIANAGAYQEERKRAETLAALDRAKTQFFSNVSHEFRTPLTLMLGPAEDALADAGTIDANRERIEVIHRNALRLLKLVNTLLDFSRIEAGRVDASYAPTDLAALTHELASTFRSAVEKAGLTLVVDCPPLSNLPEPVYVDRDMWEKIVLNLLSNAFKHTFEGHVAVTLRPSGDGRHIELAVEDTGVGIAADQLPHLFERFHRVPNARSRTHEGTGIGLALVQELVRLHGGQITVASQEGAGTTLVVRVPIGAAHLRSDHVIAGGRPARVLPSLALAPAVYAEEALRWLPADPADTIPDTTPHGIAEAPGKHSGRVAGAVGTESRPARVLLADDNADMRAYAARLLRTRGWAVETVADGQAALDAARRETPDLVLSDVMMPRLDGFGLLRELRADPRTRTVPVVLLSARAGEEARIGGMDAGADDYLVKPFSAQELVARVGAHLMLARVRQESEAKFRATFEQAAVGIAHVAPDGRWLDVNTRFCEMLGYSREELRARTFADVTHPDDRGRDLAALGRLLTGELAGYQTEKRYLRKDGETVWAQLTTALVREPEEGGGYFVSVIEDVGERKRAEAERDHLIERERSARADAEAANQAKSEFLAAMSHELRTPLNAIGGHVQLVEMGVHGPVTDAQRDALGRVQRSQQHLLSLITEVLNFAKLEAGRLEYQVETMSLSGVVAEVAPMIEPQLAAKGLAYEVRVDPDLRATADREKVQQILLNLLSNAVKFTGRGGRVTIEGATRDEGPDGGRPDAVFLRVSDTGPGIPREKQEVIFEPFVQLHRKLTRATEGAGLGLAISRDLARGMGGELRVRSTEGHGSRFTLTLPRATDAAAG